LATRALAGPSHAAAEIALRLRDVWVAAPPELREDVATTWAAPSVFDAGGRDALRAVLVDAKGTSALGAAAAVLRLGAERDAELTSMARSAVLRALSDGSTREKLQAIAALPPGEGAERVRKLSAFDDPEVRVAALTWLARSPADRLHAVQELVALAARPGGPGRRARSALATLGDRRVQAWVEADLASPERWARLVAAADLDALGRAARAAPLLADDDTETRVRAACVIVRAR
jgi:hypothetical protein